MFTSFTEREIRKFHLVVLQCQQRYVQIAWCMVKDNEDARDEFDSYPILLFPLSRLPYSEYGIPTLIF